MATNTAATAATATASKPATTAVASKPAKLKPEDSKFLYEEFKGPVPYENRRCSDIMCLFFIFLGWLAMTIIGWAALGVWNVNGLHKGDHERIMHGTFFLISLI